MKRYFALFCSCLLILFLGYTQEQRKLKEEVTVTAVEVPVRVLAHGSPIKNLTRDDFELYENGVKQTITDFEVHSKTILGRKEIPSDELKIKPRPRLFLLIFYIFDYQDPVGEAIDYFFNNIFSPGDQLIITAEDRILNIESGQNLAGLSQSTKETLKKFKVISTASLHKSLQELNLEAERMLWGLGQNVLSLIKEETHISIPLNQLKSGRYFLIIQVVDRITNLVDVFSRQIKL
jgi:hypothetical protein